MSEDIDEPIRLWNVHDGSTARVGAQQRFNILGSVADPEETTALDARLNGGSWLPVPVNLTGRPRARLSGPGDFNLDKVDLGDLRADNVLEIRQLLRGGRDRTRTVRFRADQSAGGPPAFELDLRAGEIEQFAQVVDGEWHVVEREGALSVAVGRERAGYDRILLFGDRRWTTGYEVKACLTVDAWTHYVHNVGLLFKWNPHRTDGGRDLPINWSTGLAYYASTSPGLRLRFGVDVKYRQGVCIGDHVLAEAPYRWWTRSPRWLLRAVWYASGRRHVVSQLRTGVRYCFRARVHPECYTLTVWRADRPEPSSPQIEVPSPAELLPSGAVGIIAQNAAVRVHEFRVRPVPFAEAPRSSHQEEQDVGNWPRP